MKKFIAITGAAVMALTAGSALAQSSTTQRNPIADIFGALFGDRVGVTTSIESQWAAGQTPLANQRAQFESRVDTEVRSGTINQATGTRLKSDYYDLVVLESRYGADRRFTTAERTDLADRYGDLTQVLAQGGYADGTALATADVAEGRAEFDARVNAAVAARRITRTQGTRLKSDYAAVAQLETGYLRDGVLSSAERADLDARLDALDLRVGDTYAALTPRQRLDAIGRALPTNGMSRAARAQFQVELEDISRLELAYARLSATAEERAYLERRLAELETRAGVRLGNSAF
jgi:hypothetical protein